MTHLRTASLGIALALAACSSSNDGGPATPDAGAACAPYVVPSSTDLTQPAVHLRADVIPIVTKSCGLSSSCHASEGPANHGIYLKDNPDLIVASAVGQPSTELPSMPRVTAGDPSKSWLMKKIDGDYCTFTAQCAGGDCGVLMPQGVEEPLPVATRDVVRRWIAQGAKND